MIVRLFFKDGHVTPYTKVLYFTSEPEKGDD